MKRLLASVLLAAFAASVPLSTAWADETLTEGEYRIIDGKRTLVRYNKNDVIDLDGALIQLELRKPSIMFIRTRTTRPFDEMLEERAHFKVELIESLEEI